jgi:hypothetical protein
MITSEVHVVKMSVFVGGRDNIKLDLQEVGCVGVMDWIDMDQDRNRCRALVCAIMKHRVGKNAGNFLTG